MEEFNGYDSFIFYRGWAETAKGFAEDFGEDFAKEMIWALVCYICFGEIVTEKKSIIKWIEGDCLRAIEAAKKRHDASIEAGKLGGRPSKINKDDVLSLKQDGKTVKEIAEILGCSRDGIEKILNGSRQTDKPTNLRQTYMLMKMIMTMRMLMEMRMAWVWRKPRSPLTRESLLAQKSS